MKQFFKLLGLLTLLLVAQQGAVVHELSHVTGTGSESAVKAARSAIDSNCAQCPAFAQVATPAFSHSFDIPQLVRQGLDPIARPLYLVLDSAVPTPRSRGPPSLT
jgi:hypothetical protein